MTEPTAKQNTKLTAIIEEIKRDTDRHNEIALCHNLGVTIGKTNDAYSTFLSGGLNILCAPVTGESPTEEEYELNKNEYEKSRMEFYKLRDDQSQLSLTPIQASVKNLHDTLPYVRDAMKSLGKCRFKGPQLEEYLTKIDKLLEDLHIEEMLQYMDRAVKSLSEPKNNESKSNQNVPDLMGTLDDMFGDLEL